ncbi:hypothetical protein NHX12_032209 [Muraenolepis orangiensis]|uniref:Cytochrome P450 n=1 Tax=Muraenolepis orangiensis TaxID=630683 RepID=A0A9Q0E6Q1_9TELE|nr:hypothetical protein NHX12_032209 [Muraenolepis orangiensis]
MELLEVLHSLTSVTLLGAVLFLLVLFFFSRSRNLEQRKEPPGPRPLPLIGNLLQLDFMKPHITLWELSKKFGHVFTVYLGPKKVVVLAGYKTVKQALVNNAEEFGERELIQITKSSGGHGILFANGESWKEMRRFALTTLRDFGMGKKISEEKIIEECQNLMEVFQQYKGQLQEELSSVIGSRQVRVEDRKNLPYTDAVIHEIQRLANILPMSLPHTTSQDITFQGYFINKDGKFVKRDAFMPFSAGRRACVGESLARMELFLFFTTLLQHYRFTPPPGVTEDELDLTPTLGLTLNPSLHQLCAHSRDSIEGLI